MLIIHQSAPKITSQVTTILSYSYDLILILNSIASLRIPTALENSLDSINRLTHKTKVVSVFSSLEHSPITRLTKIEVNLEIEANLQRNRSFKYNLGHALK